MPGSKAIWGVTEKLGREISMYPGNKLAILALIFAAISLRGQAASAETVYGEAKKLGNGFAQLYAGLEANGAPRVLGVSFVEGMLEGLPAVPNTYSRCFDKNGDGKIGARGECNGAFELIFPLPREVGELSEMPFKWIGVNWNPERPPPSRAAAVGRAAFRFSLLHTGT